MKAVVRRRLFRPAPPLVIGFHDVLLRVGDDEIDDHGGAAGQARRRAAEKILGRHGAHERQLHVRMGVYAAGHDMAAAGIDDFGWAAAI